MHDDGQAASNPCQKKLSVLISYIPSCFNIQKDICKDDTHTKRMEKRFRYIKIYCRLDGQRIKREKKGEKISSALGKESFLLSFHRK